MQRNPVSPGTKRWRWSERRPLVRRIQQNRVVALLQILGLLAFTLAISSLDA